MLNVFARSAIAASLAATTLSGCNQAPNPENLQKAGYTAAAKSSTLTCFDYSGNQLIRQTTTEKPMISGGHVYTSDDSVTVANSAGCIIETNYATGDLSKADGKITAIALAGPVVVLHEKFSNVMNFSDETVYELKAQNGTTLREVRVTGLTNFGTKQPQGISPDIKQSLGL